jgi:hypothetical protein
VCECVYCVWVYVCLLCVWVCVCECMCVSVCIEPAGSNSQEGKERLVENPQIRTLAKQHHWNVERLSPGKLGSCGWYQHSSSCYPRLNNSRITNNSAYYYQTYIWNITYHEEWLQWYAALAAETHGLVKLSFTAVITQRSLVMCTNNRPMLKITTSRKYNMDRNNATNYHRP